MPTDCRVVLPDIMICWKLLIGVCALIDGLAAFVCVYRTSAASVDLLRRGSRAVAFPRSLHEFPAA